MMIRHIAYITGLLLMALCSCSDEILLPDTTSGAEVPDGTPIEIEVSAEFPEMSFGPGTRMSDQPTADDLRVRLKINILVFDEAGIMQQFIPPTDIKNLRIDDTEKKVTFDVQNIYSSSQPRRLHFVVTSAPDILQIPGGELITAMANETTVMPALMAEGKDTDTYWGTDVVSKITEESKLSMKVIRNFVKLDVAVTPNDKTKDFELLGYTVVNRPNKGTVAPYIYEKKIFANFMDPEETDGLKTYDEIISQGYHGINPAGQEENMTHTEKTVNESDLGLSPVYMYERSQSGIETVGADAKVTYLIVKGNYTNEKNEKKTYYYKLDLGHNVGGKFKFYDLLRNFQYTAQINEVSGPGAKSLQDAMDGMPYNNISASVVTHDLFSISYTGELITVSDTEVIFTEQTDGFQLSFRYYLPKYPDDPNSENIMKPEFLKVYDLGVPNATEYDVSGLTDEYGNSNGTEKEIDLSGEVIQSAKLTKGTGEWYILKITTKDIPSNGRLEQNLRIYYSEQKDNVANLGRSITLMLRQPWDLIDVNFVKNSTIKGKDKDGKEITLEAYDVNFTLPSGLSNSQFPLTLTFESDKQNIYSLKGTELQVAVGKSGFKGATTDNIMRYEYVISRANYDPNKVYTATFLTNTTTDEDKTYSTAGIDDAMKTNGNRTLNNGTNTFCIKIANAGQKCIEPYYVNITRQ